MSGSKKFKVLSLCDGGAGGLLAFKELGIEVEYHAVEIDKFARAVADANCPEIIRWEHDVNWIAREDIEEHGPYDYVMFGSPCQSVSVAGKREGLSGSSGLLLDCLKVLRWCQEDNSNLKFLIENVKMSKAHLAEFNELIGVEPVLINSAPVSAQNRNRYYWGNFPIILPEDKGEMLKDILEEVPIEEFEELPTVELSSEKEEWLLRNVDKELAFGWSKSSRYKDSKGKVSSSPKNGGVRYIEDRLNLSGKSNTLTTSDGCGAQSSLNMVVRQEDGCLFYRKLTVRECARLQKIPEWYDFSTASKNQAYRIIGNGWTISAIAHILNCSFEREEELL